MKSDVLRRLRDAPLPRQGEVVEVLAVSEALCCVLKAACFDERVESHTGG